MNLPRTMEREKMARFDDVETSCVGMDHRRNALHKSGSSVFVRAEQTKIRQVLLRNLSGTELPFKRKSYSAPAVTRTRVKTTSLIAQAASESEGCREPLWKPRKTSWLPSSTTAIQQRGQAGLLPTCP